MKRFRSMLMILLSVPVLILGQVNAQEDHDFLPKSEVIDVDNANQLKEVATLGLGEIYDIAYSPNGEEAAIASATGLSVYSVNDWSIPSRIIKNNGERVAVAFTKDSQSLITYPIDDVYWLPVKTGDLKSYDISSGVMNVLIANFMNFADNIAIDPQGRWIASVEQECQHSFTGISCPIDSTSTQAVQIYIRDMTSGKILETITPNKHIYDIKFQPKSSTLVFLGRGVEDTDSLVFWDIDKDKQISLWSFEQNKYTQFAISGDGHTIGLPLEAATKRYIHVDFLDIQTQAIRNSFEINYEALKALGSYYSDYRFGGRIWLNNDASQVFTQEYTDPGISSFIWDTKTGLNVFPYTDSASYVPARTVTFSPTKATSLIVLFNDAVLQWDVKTETINTLIGGQRFMEHAILSADNQLLAIEGERYGHSLYDFQTGRRLTLPENSQPLAISADSKLLALVINNEIRIWDRQNDSDLTSIQLNKDVALSAAFSPNNKLLALGLEPSMIFDTEGNVEESSWELVRVYDVETGKLLAVERSYGGRNEKLLFSADGSLIVTDDGIWNVREWLSSGTVDQSNSPEWLIGLPLALSDNGRLLATASDADNNRGGRHIIHVFEIQSGKQLFTLDAHHGDINALAFNPSGTLLASASGDGDADVRDNSVRLWNLESGDELMTLETQYYDYMRDVVFSNDGKYIITLRGGCDYCEGWGFNSAVRIWGIPQNN